MSFPTERSVRQPAARLAVALLVALGAAGGSTTAAAEGLELTPSLGSEFGYDSNVLREGNDRKGDGVFRLSPQLNFAKPRGDLTFDTSYRFGYEHFLTRSQIDDTDNHFFTGSLDWHLSDRTQFGLRESFAYTRDLNSRFESGAIDTTPDVEVRRQRRTANNATVSFSHLLTPRWQFESDASQSYRDAESESSSVRGSAQMLYFTTPRLSVGAGSSGGYTSFDGSGTRVGNRSLFVQGFVVTRYRWSPTVSLEASGGPAWTRTSIAPSATSLARNNDDTRINFFGSASVTKSWQKANASLRYQRTNGGASGNRSDDVTDSVRFNFGWTPRERWQVSSAFGWALRQGESNFGTTGSTDEETTTYLALLRLNYQLTQHASVYWLGDFRRQEQNRDLSGTNDDNFNDFRTFVGFRWTFEPVQL